MKYIEKIIEKNYEETFILKGIKGVTIEKRIIKNHISDMVQVLDGIEKPLLKTTYLVVTIPQGKTNMSIWKKHQRKHSLFSLREMDDYILLCFYTPHIFHHPLLHELEKEKIVRIIWKEKVYGYTYYVNAKNWQILYNVFSYLSEFVHKGVSILYIKALFHSSRK